MSHAGEKRKGILKKTSLEALEDMAHAGARQLQLYATSKQALASYKDTFLYHLEELQREHKEALRSKDEEFEALRKKAKDLKRQRDEGASDGLSSVFAKWEQEGGQVYKMARDLVRSSIYSLDNDVKTMAQVQHEVQTGMEQIVRWGIEEKRQGRRV
jgi:hypothetical protein